jgi:two-component system sensor kinase FixL
MMSATSIPLPARPLDEPSTPILPVDRLGLFGAAATTAAVYYAGAQMGLALTSPSSPLSILWPPNALLFAMLVMTSTRRWWVLAAGAFPAHLVAELQGGVPLAMVLGWFVSNFTEAAIGAWVFRWWAGLPGHLSTLRSVVAFGVSATVAAAASSFLDAGFVRLTGFGSVDYWTLWRSRLLSNVLASLTFVPVIVTLASAGPVGLLTASRARVAEGAALLGGLAAVCLIAFDLDWARSNASLGLLSLPMAFLVWAALRFGPPMTAAAFTTVALSVIWGAGHGQGPFLEPLGHAAVFPIQVFLILTAVPVLFLAAVIEERRRAVTTLRASEELFSTAFHASPDALAISRIRDGAILQSNARWRLLLQYEQVTARGSGIAPIASHLLADDRDRLLKMLDEGVQVRDEEVALRDHRGERRVVQLSMVPVRLQDENCMVHIVRDITQQRRAESEARDQRQQLTHVTRVASLTDFSSTLAHELNQPLTAILSNAQAALRYLAHTPPNVAEIRSILGEIADADKRAGLLIHRLRGMMKKGPEEFAPLDLNQLVRDVLDFVRGEFSIRDVTVSASFSPDLPQVNADRVQLQQLVLNLVSNACEAMTAVQGRRQLSIVTQHGRDDAVHLLVCDTGPGITGPQLDHVFEPFFTTKANGLGLGLSICRNIARAHGGTLTAETSDDRGARLRLVLPRFDPARTAPRPASTADERA